MNQTPEHKQLLFEYCLWLGDSSLVLGHRLSEWCGHGPILEEDIALTNIALDLVGQARLFLTYAGEVEGKGRSEDDIAYLRDVLQYRNTLLTEQPNGDYGKTIVRQFLFDSFQLLFFEGLKKSKDMQLSAIAEKSLKETQYHFRHSSQWLWRLGDGTDESHTKVQTGLDDLWMFTDDLFYTPPSDEPLITEGIAVDLHAVKPAWSTLTGEWFAKARLKIPTGNLFMFTGGRRGSHTEHLGYILADMQFLPRAYPEAKW